MILFDIRCRESGDVFEAWFGSSADYDDQRERGLVQCPVCSSSNVEKAPMAPRLPAKPRSGDARAVIAALTAAQTELLRHSTWVGDRFADKARAMHLGEEQPKPVHGTASAAEARSLADEGIPVAPLPLPVIPPDQVN